MKKRGSFSKKSLVRSLGLLLFLFVLFLLLSPLGAFYPLAYGLAYLFGLAYFFVLTPYLLFTGATLALTGRAYPGKKGGLRLFFSALLLALAVDFFFAYASFEAGTAITSASFFENASEAYARGASMYVDLRLAGGLVVTPWAASLSSMAGSFLSPLIGSFLVLSALIVFLYPYIASYCTKMDARVKEAKARKAASPSYEAPSPQKEEKGSVYFQTPPTLVSEDEGQVSGLRYAPEAEGALPKEVAPSPLPDYIPREAIRFPGLQEARFAFPEEDRPSAMKKVEPQIAPEPAPKEEEPTHIENELSLADLEMDAAPTLPPSPPRTDIPPVIPISIPERKSEPADPKPMAPSAPKEEESILPPPLPSTPPMEAPSFLSEEPKEEKKAEEAPSQEEAAAEEPEEEARDPLPGELSLEELSMGPASVHEPEPPKKEEPAPEPEPEPEPEPLTPYEKLGVRRAHPLPPYVFPSLDLLKTYGSEGDPSAIESECEARAAIINQTLADFGVGAEVVGYTVGPSVTRYDIKCQPGVQVSTIGRYVRDISVRLSGLPTRFEEIVPGKQTSGLEIANTKTTIVPLREMVQQLPTGPKKNLYIPFGKSISGDYIAADLAEFPHMLVAGGSGSGKSIFMHGLIMSLIMRNRPEDLRLVLIDPKRIEMSKYKEIPHLMTHIVKDADEAKVCLKKLCDEMDRRYDILDVDSFSNIRDFNNYAAEEGYEKLPFIVVVIDEYADLVQTNKEIGEYVVRLAQKARAAGIHLIIATQRPSVDVITGVIKANLQVRVALRVSSSQDSMVILSQGGAEDLNGYGDMLVDCSLVSRSGLTRAQGCMVDSLEIKRVTDFIKTQAGVNYDPSFVDLSDRDAAPEVPAMEALSGEKSSLKVQQGDDFYRGVVEQIIQCEFTSISKIQRQFGIGFPRAGRIFAHLQRDKIVSLESAASSKGCPVLVHTMEEAEALMTSEAKE